MNSVQISELVTLIDKYSNTEGLEDTAIPNLSLFRATKTDTPLPSIYETSLCLIVQGQKQTMLGKEMYHYGASQYLIVSVDLPVIGKIIKASKGEPYFAVKIDVDLKQLSELLIQIDRPLRTDGAPKRALFIGEADEAIADGVLRLMRLLDTPEEIPVLASQTIREIFYRVLIKDHGETFSQIALKGSTMYRISNAIQKIKGSFQENIVIDELADIAGMSISSFHAHFKTVTAMSPLQFQKSLRLMEARSLMITSDSDATTAAYHVGYESASQFSREYARMFGSPPMRDIENLKSGGAS